MHDQEQHRLGLWALTLNAQRPCPAIDRSVTNPLSLVTISNVPIISLDAFQQFAAINVLSDPGHIGGPVVVPNCVKVMPLWQLGDGKVTRNVLGGIITSFTTASQGVAEAIRAAIAANSQFGPLLAQLAPTASFLGVEIQDIRQAGNPVFRSTGAAVPGTGTGTELPDEVALVLTLRTAKTGQGNRGRLYQPGWSSASLGAGNVATAAAVTALTNYPNAINAGMSAGGLSWGLIQPARAAYVSPKTGTSHPARSAACIPVTNFVVRDNHWDSQRRRGLK